MGAEADTPELDELELLVHLVETYEARVYPVPAPAPVDAIRFRMEQQALTAKDLAPLLGGAGAAKRATTGCFPTCSAAAGCARSCSLPGQAICDS